MKWLFFFLAGWLYLFSLPVFSQTIDTAQLTNWERTGRKLFLKNKYVEAHRYADSVLQVWDITPLPVYPQYGRALLLKGESFMFQSTYDTAIFIFEKILNEYDLKEEQVLKLHQARAHLRMGNCYRRTGDFNKAAFHLNQGVDIQKKILPADDIRLADAYNTLGLFLAETGENEAALEVYDKALFINLQQSPLDTGELGSLRNNMGIAYYNLGNLKEALFNYNEAFRLDSMHLGMKHFRLGSICLNIGAIHLTSGTFQEAVPYLEKSYQIFLVALGEKNARVGIALINLGSTYFQLGQYDLAVETIRKAIKVYTENFSATHYNLYYCYTILGEVYKESGDAEKSLINNELAHQIAAANFKKPHSSLILTLTALGNSYLVAQEPEKAWGTLLEALEMFEELPNKGNATAHGLFTVLGSCLISLERYEEALEYLERGRIYTEEYVGAESPLLSDFDFYRGLCLQAMGDFDSALVEFERVRAARGVTYAKPSAEYLDPMLHEGQCLAGKGDLLGAIEIADTVLMFVQQDLKTDKVLAPNLFSTLEAYTLKGKNARQLFERTGEQRWLEMAQKNLLEGTEQLEDLRTSHVSEHSRQVISQSNFLLFEEALRSTFAKYELFEESSVFETLFELAEKSKSLALLEAVKKTEATAFANIPDSLIRQQLQLASKITHEEKQIFELKQQTTINKDTLVELTNRILQLKNRYENLLKTLEVDYPLYHQLKYGLAVISLSETKNRLLPDQALIEYFVGDSTLFAFFITPDAHQIFQLPRNASLEKQLENLHKGLYGYWLLPQDLRTPEAWEQHGIWFSEAAANLYQQLIAPLGTLPEKLIIVPDGVLGYLPFEVLLMEKPEQVTDFKTHAYLLKNHQISYNYSATLWQEMRQKQHQSKGLLAMAPSFSGTAELLADVRSFRRNNLGSLAWNVPEVTQIHDLWGGELLTDTLATVANFFQFAPQAAILHLATHAKLDDKNSDYSFLAFAKNQDSLDDGRVFIRDLYNLQLPADLVVLSACETGMGKLQRGEGIISLARGFAYAGAKSIVTSLWEVNDKATAEIMTIFYRYLKAGDSKEIALQKAKFDYMDGQVESRFAHPFYWAAFVGVGDMSPIDSGSVWWTWWLIGLVGVGVFVGILRWRRRLD